MRVGAGGIWGLWGTEERRKPAVQNGKTYGERVSKKASLEGKQAAIKTREKQGGSPSAKGRAQLLQENRQ